MTVKSKDDRVHNDDSNKNLEILVQSVNYEEIEKIRGKNDISLVESNPMLYLEQAYLSYQLGEYLTAYKYLLQSSKLFFRKKEYMWYALSEINRESLGRFILRNLLLANEVEREKISSDLEQLDVESLLANLPFSSKKVKELLVKIHNLARYYVFYRDVSEMSDKVVKQSKSSYLLFIGEPEYKKLRFSIENIYNFDFYNYIMVDCWKDVVDIYRQYGDAVIKSITAKEGFSKDGFNEGCIKVRKLSGIDIFLIAKYFKTTELSKLLKECCWEKLDIEDSDAVWKIIINSLESEKININYLLNLIVLINYINVRNTEKNKLIPLILSHLEILKIHDLHTVANDFCRFLYEYSGNLDEIDLSEEIIMKSLKYWRIQLVIADNKFIRDLSYNLVYNLLKIYNASYDKIPYSLIEDILNEQQLELLIDIYDFCDKKGQKKIDVLKQQWEWRGTECDYRIYEKLLIKKEIEPVIKTERKICDEVSSNQSESKMSYFMDFKENTLLRLYINGFVINKDFVNSILKKSNYRVVKWLLNIEGFNYDDFDVNFLIYFPPAFFKDALTPEIKQKIINCIKVEYSHGRLEESVLDRFFEILI